MQTDAKYPKARSFWKIGLSPFFPLSLSFLGVSMSAMMMSSILARGDGQTPSASRDVVRAKLAARGEYELGPLDRVRLTIVAWRPSRDEVFEWKAINREYTVGPSGMLSLPLIGEIEAAGSTISDLSQRIAIGLQQRIGLAERPDASVEVVSFRPFYIVGDVNQPGEFAYRPGMNVIQALSIAGGTVRVAPSEAMRLERDVIGSAGMLSELTAERATLVVRRARIEAEVNGYDSFDVTDTGGDADRRILQVAIDQEKRILRSKVDARNMEVESLHRIRRSLTEELATIKAQFGPQEALTALAATTSGVMEDSFRKRIVTQPRLIEAQRTLAQAKGDGMLLKGRLQATARELSKTESAIAALNTKLRSDSLLELSRTSDRLEQVDHKISTARRLMTESTRVSPKFGSTNLQFVIVRSTGSELQASETTLVSPGDTIKVIVPETDQAATFVRWRQPSSPAMEFTKLP